MNDMNDFDKIIASKLDQVTNFEPKKEIWNKIEASLTAQPTLSEKPLSSFYAGIAMSAAIGLMLTQLPAMGPIHPTQNALAENQNLTLDSETWLDDHSNLTDKNAQETSPFSPQQLHEIDLAENSTTEQLAKGSELNKVGKLSPAAKPSISEKSNPIEASSNKTTESKPSLLAAKTSDEQVAFKASGIQCPDQNITFSAIGDFDRYEWLFDGTELHYGKDVSVTFNEPGKHQVLLLVYQGDQKLSKVKTIEIFDNPSPVVNSIVENETNCFKSKVKWIANPEGLTYKWNFNGNESIGNENTQYLETGSHGIFLTAINQYGCVATSEHNISVTTNKQLFIPGAFSPDNNGKNDTWFPEGLEDCSRFTVKVFTLSTGSLVYETNELNPWNGILNETAGMAQRGEQYIYEVMAEDACGLTTFKKGVIKVF